MRRDEARIRAHPTPDEGGVKQAVCPDYSTQQSTSIVRDWQGGTSALEVGRACAMEVVNPAAAGPLTRKEQR